MSSDLYSGARGIDSRSGHIMVHHGFGHEIMAILSLPLIQIGQLSATGESMRS